MIASEQLDLLELLPPEPKPWQLPCPRLFGSTLRGVQERWAEFRAWQQAYDDFGSIPRSHAWIPDEVGYRSDGLLDQLPSRCLPTVLSAELRCDHHGQACYCVGGRYCRGACFGCQWEGHVHEDTTTAVEDAHDHAWPGWRDLPIVPKRPDEEYARRGKTKIPIQQQWADKVRELYPDGWLDAGGPIVTSRCAHATRDIPNGTRLGGYDIAARPFHAEARQAS